MKNAVANPDVAKISVPAARLAMGASVVASLSLVGLNILSPEFDPAWRMISEYANGHYSWLLSLMFLCWGVGAWALAYALRSQMTTRAGKVGLVFLVLAGFGEIMASMFDINHVPFHDIAGFLGTLGLPVAALLISTRLSRTTLWSDGKKAMLGLAHLAWICVVLQVAAFALMIGTFIQSGVKVDPSAKITTLPHGVIGLVGWPNRLLVLVYCVWVMVVAWQAIKVRRTRS